MASERLREIYNMLREALTRVDSHMSIPCRSIVQRFAANWTLLAFFGIAHARRSYFLHVVVQLQLLKKVKINHLLFFFEYGVFLKDSFMVYSSIKEIAMYLLHRGVTRYEIVVGHTLNPLSKSGGALCYQTTKKW